MESPPNGTIRAAERTYDFPRDYLDNSLVSVGISPRARGLAVDVNLNPDAACNFDCVYCGVLRSPSEGTPKIDVAVMADELEKTLVQIGSGEIRQRPRFARLSEELLLLRHVALSGDGEPTLCPVFTKAVEAVVHLRARRQHGFFKLVLSTNGTVLDWPEVQDGLQYFTRSDEIWIKLDAGAQSHMDQINRGATPLEKVLDNALILGRRRPIVIQSLFPMLEGCGPAAENVDEYIRRLNHLKNGGATISAVQIFSATQSRKTPGCGHLPLQTLRDISSRVRAETGLKSEVF